jgi:hypothetical protein
MSATPPRDDNEKWYSIYLIINLKKKKKKKK